MREDQLATPTPATGNGARAVMETDRESASEARLGDLFRQLAQDSGMLMRQEMALAKAELQQNVRTAIRDATMVAVGGGLALVGALVLVLFLVLAVGDAVDEYWLGALIVGVVLLGTGAILAMGALRKLRSDGLAPERTIQTLKEDKQWAQREIRQVREDLA